MAEFAERFTNAAMVLDVDLAALYGVANCDHLQNLTAPPKPGSRPIATNMSHVARFTDAFPFAAIVSTLSRHLRWNHFVNLQQIHKDSITAAEYWTNLPRKAVLCARTLAQRKLPVENRIRSDHFDPTSYKIKAMATKVNKGLEVPVVALPGVWHMPEPGKMKSKQLGCFMWRLLERRKGW